MPSAPVVPPVKPEPVTAASLAQQLQTGTLTTAQVAKLAKAGNIDLMDVAHAHTIFTEPATRQAPDTRTEEQRTFDVHFPVAREADYQIQWGDAIATHPQEVEALDANFRGWMHAIGLSREHGHALVAAVDRAARAMQRMTPEEQNARSDRQTGWLHAALGTQSDGRLTKTGEMLQAVEQQRPGVTEFIRTHQHIFNDAMVAKIITEAVERWHLRRGNT